MIDKLRKELQKRSDDEIFISGTCSYMKYHHKIEEMLKYLEENPDAKQGDISWHEYKLVEPIISQKEYQLSVKKKLEELHMI